MDCCKICTSVEGSRKNGSFMVLLKMQDIEIIFK